MSTEHKPTSGAAASTDAVSPAPGHQRSDHPEPRPDSSPHSVSDDTEVLVNTIRLWIDDVYGQAAHDCLDRLVEQLEAAQQALREIGRTYDGVTPIFRKTGPKMLGADAFTYAPDICEALNRARRWPVTYPASERMNLSDELGGF